MKSFFLFLLCILSTSSINSQNRSETPLKIICIGAHPDDTDQQMGGTAALFAEMGHHVKFVSVTNGDAGHYRKGGGQLAKIRREEAAEAGRRLGINEYKVLDNHDGELLPTLDVRHQIIREIRNWDADVVISHRPIDYHPDHRNTGIIVQDAAYLVIVPNIVSDTSPLEKNPLFLYLEDDFQKPYPFQPDIAIDITDVFEKKINAHDAHKSQMYEWLPWISKKGKDVPEEPEERMKWLKENWTLPISSKVRESLRFWYGKEKANTIKHAEAFEICEYGYQPSKEEILQLFPMLN